MEIHAHMVNSLGDDTPGLLTMQKWAAEFKRGQKSLEDDSMSGWPVTPTIPEIIDRVHQVVMGDRRLTISHVAEEIGISREQVENLLHKELGWSKVFARWVPRLLTPDQKRIRMVTSQASSAIFEANPDGFCKRFVTRDECWVHDFEAGSKQQSMQWKHKTSPVRKKSKVVALSGKVMALYSGMQREF